MSTLNPFQKFSPKLFRPGGNPSASPVALLSHIFRPVKNLASANVSAANVADPRIAATLAGIAHNETRGVKGDPYAFSQPSGNPLYGNALGRYQITEDLLKNLGPKYLGAPITSKDFLATPAMQESFMQSRTQNLLKQGYTPEQIADIHRHGSTREAGSRLYNRPEYVQEFQRGYGAYTSQNLPKGQTKKQ